jgi:hypothetical protein
MMSHDDESRSLCDMDKDVLTLIASSLSPPDVFALVRTSKSLFWGSSDASPLAELLAVNLLQASLKRHLDVLLKDLTRRAKTPFTLADLFPDEERAKDFDASGRPQVRAKEGGTLLRKSLPVLLWLLSMKL